MTTNRAHSFMWSMRYDINFALPDEDILMGYVKDSVRSGWKLKDTSSICIGRWPAAKHIQQTHWEVYIEYTATNL